MKLGVFLCSCNKSMSIDFKKVKKRIEKEVEFVEIHDKLCQKEGLAYIIDGIRRKELDTLLITCDLKKDYFESLNLGEIHTINIRELCGWVHDKKEATQKAISMLREAIFRIDEEKPRKLIKETGNKVLIVGGSNKAIEVAGNLAKFADVTLLVNSTPEAKLPEINLIFGEIKKISGRVGDFEVKYVPNPIDENLCILCGKCAEICKENAVKFNKRYFITSECTKCKECINLCPTNAIDFDREEKTIEANHVITESEISYSRIFELLYNLGEAEIEKYVEANLDYCASGKSELIGCNLCVIACPNQAIVREGEKIHFEELLCSGCGVCSAVCPISIPKLIGSSISERIKILLDNELKSKILLIACEEKKEKLMEIGRAKEKYPAVLPLFCKLGEISEVDLLYAMIYGADGIAIYACKECLEKAERSKSLEMAKLFLKAFGLEDRIKIIADEELKDLSFTPIKHKKIEIKGNKREKLVELMQSFSELYSMKKLRVEGDYPFAELTVSDACTFCDACLSMCPTEALRKEGEKLLFTYAKCMACGLCQKACPEKAIELKKVLDIEKLSKEEAITLYEAELVKCKKCGKPFASKKIIEKVLAMDVDIDKELLLYCEECRPAIAMKKFLENMEK